jgi:hypothetical protein
MACVRIKTYNICIYEIARIAENLREQHVDPVSFSSARAGSLAQKKKKLARSAMLLLLLPTCDLRYSDDLHAHAYMHEYIYIYIYLYKGAYDVISLYYSS